MKKGLLVLLSAFLLLFTACDSWMQDDEFYDDIENEVKVANAQQISVFVRYAMTRQGKTDPDGPATFKVEIPHSISATTEPEFGFVRWAAFSTEFLETGNNQSKNKDVYFIDYEDYNARLLPKEIKSPVVVFEDATNPTTTVTINENRNDIFLVPIVAQRPTVSLTIPAKGSSGVVRNMSVRINFTKPMDEDSFKNSEGVFDKITVTQGIQTFTTDGDIEISSVDITDRFEAPVFSANKKMVTLRFNQESISEGYDSQSSVNIIISKDVKDIFGFAMTDDDKISFSVGSSMDTLAPRITSLTAGTTLTNFDTFKGMYKDAATWDNITAFTKMDPHQKGSGQNATYLGAKDAPVNNLDSSFYDTFAPPADASNSGYRITDKIYIHALAEDIAGSGSNQNQTGIETDVAMLGVRATLMYNADGTVPDASATNVTIPTTSVNYMPQSVGQSLAKDYVYKNLVHAINVKNGTPNASDEGYIAEDKGFLFEYDLSSLPDGLIRVDIFAVDMVQNSGLAVGGELSEEYGNGYASIFVVKDTTAPDATANSGHVIVDTGADSHITADNYFNEVTYSRLKIKGDASSIVDYGHPRLRSHHDNMKWIVKPTDKTDWVSSIKTTDSSWGSITSNYGPFPNPGNEGKVYYTYALMDDVGNVSNAVGINPIYYDSVAPEVQVPYFVADEGFTAGVAKDNVLNEQTLVIPVKEITSGLKSIELMVRKNGATTDYATPLADSSLAVVAKDKDGNEVPYTVDSAKKVITFNQPITDFDSNVTIKGLKLSDDLNEQGSFEVSVLVKDAAAADSVHETLPANPAVSNTDSIPVQINTVYIPNIRKTERFGVANSAEFWIDYNASTLTKRAGSNPLTDVYITFTEETSGAKIFDFTGSSITLTDDSNGNGSKIYKVNAATGTIDGIAIPSTVSGNKLIINSSVDAKDYFANPNGEHKLTVKITNVALANEGTDSAIALKIYDTATNGSAAGTTICSNEGSLNLTTPGISTAGFKFDSAAPASEMAEDALCDRDGTESDSTATEASGKTTAELGYTNENLINASVTLNPRASGISSLRISGDAAFVTSTTIKANGSNVEFDISDSGKVVTFKQNNNHVVLGSASAAPVVLTINNLQLTSGDGAKNITFLARSFGNVEDSVGSTKSITLDTQAPQWIDNGLYAAAHNNVSSEGVYPHSVSDGKAYGLAGIDSTKPAELYFYRRYYICIKPDVSDDNLKDAAVLINYTKDGAAVTNNNAAYSPDTNYGYTYHTGVFTATAKDRAGNKSTVKTFHIVADTEFASTADCSKLDKYMVLYRPAGAFIHRNTAVSEESGFTEYIIKGDAQYQLRIKLGGATTVSNSEGDEESIDKPGETGSTVLKETAYEWIGNTTTSSKIEYYAVHIGNSISNSSSFTWHPYTVTSSTQPHETGFITSYVDAAGTIYINLPHSTCLPVSIVLKDACGNITYRSIRPEGMTNSVIQWTVDSSLGVEGNYEGTAGYSYPSAVKTTSDVTFYNNTATLTLSDCSDKCRFDDSGASTAEELANGIYTMKSRILLWPTTKNREPNQMDFHNESETLTSWYGVKQAPGDDLFNLVNNFPMPDSATTPYKLYYIIEDTVGNNRVEKITKSNKDLWLFDNIAPQVDETLFTFGKINTVSDNGTNKNYYSNNSYVVYNISDYGSGIWKGGDSEHTYSYSNFDNRNQTLPATDTKFYLKSAPTSGELKITNISDYAGNTKSTDKLKYNNVTTWVQQTSAPKLLSTGFGEVSNETAYYKDKAKYNISYNASVNSETSEKVLLITSRKENSKLSVKLKVDESVELLGWLISNEKLTSFKDFYTEAELTKLPYDSTSKWYTYSGYHKTRVNHLGATVEDNKNPWMDLADYKVKYFYPVNRAGLISQDYIKVEFAINQVPSVSDISYSAGNTITTYGSGNNRINFTKSNARLKFKTSNITTEYNLVKAKGDDGEWGGDDDTYVYSSKKALPAADSWDSDTETGWNASESCYYIALDTDELKALSEGQLALQVFTANEDSDPADLNGPADFNRWIFDETAPAVTFTASAIENSANSVIDTDTTKYIKNATAVINLNITESETSTAKALDVAHYQWKVGDAAWDDIPAANIDSNPESTSFGKITFTAPADKTLYQFQVIDKAGNVSEAHEFSTSSGAKYNTVTLQCDNEAPGGDFDYTTKNGSSENDLIAAGLNISYNGNDEIRDISYSSTSGDKKIDSIFLDFSAITQRDDKIDGIERSGIQKYQIVTKKGSGTETTEDLSATKTSHTINLSENDEDVVYTYTVKVIDNINQERTLKTFRTNADNTPPSLTSRTIFADEAKSIAAVNSGVGVATDPTYYLKGDKAVITFNIIDTNATYEWKSSDTSSYSDLNHSDVDYTSTSITWTFDAPEDKVTYYFKGTDRVGNPSDPISVTLQKDKWAPGEGQTTLYSIKRPNADTPSTLDNVTLSDGLNVKNGTDEDYRIIKYSSVEGTTNYATKLDVDFSNINDIVDSKNRSGIENFYLTKGTGSSNSISLTDKHYSVNLTSTLNETIYKFTVKDNIGQERTLKTFKLTADNKKPDLDLAETNPVKTYSSTDSNDIHNVTSINNGSYDIYFLKKDKAQITFSIDDTSATYMWKKGNGTWAAIPDENKSIDSTNNTLTVTDNTPDSVTLYSFKAVDGVYNESAPIELRLMQDYAAPTANITSALKNGDNSAVDGTYENISGTIVYKAGAIASVPDAVTKLVLTIPDGADNDGGSGFEGYYLNGSKLTASSNPKLEDNTVTINLAPSDAVNNTYTITAKDMVGNESEPLLSLNLKSDASAPNFTLSTVQTKGTGTTYDVTAIGTGDAAVYYLKRANAILTFATTTSEDIDHYEWDNGTGTYLSDSLTLDSMACTFEAPDTITTYLFKAVDAVGNATEIPVKLVKDVDAPSGTITYKLWNGNSETPSTDQKEYVTNATETTPATTLIGYNKAAATKIVFDTSLVTDGTNGSGLKKLTYKVNGGEAQDFPSDGAISGINANDFANGTTYEIIATDNVGNTATLNKFVLRGVSGGPKVPKEKAPYYSGLQYVPTYPYVAITESDNPNVKGADGKYTHKANWVKAFDKDDNNVYYITAGGAEEIKESNNLTENDKIYAYNDKGEPNGQTVPKGYSIRLLQTGTQFRLPVIAASLPSDKLYYAITYNTIAEPGADAWTEKTVVKVDENDENAVKCCIKDIPIDLTKVDKRHTVIFVWYKDDLGNICVHNLTYPDKTDQNWWTTSDHKGEDGDLSDLNGGTPAFVYPTANKNGTFGLGFTGLKKFVTETVGIGTSNSTSRVSSFFNSVANVFARDSEVVENSVNEKPAETAKKAAKKAKKTAKKAGKKASAKTQIAEKPVMTVETAEIVDETVSITVPEVTAVAESVVNELSEVTENVTGESEVVTIAPAAESSAEVESAEQPAEASQKKSPSRSASIVIMLAILSSLSGAWYYKKGRKE